MNDDGNKNLRIDSDGFSLKLNNTCIRYNHRCSQILMHICKHSYKLVSNVDGGTPNAFRILSTSDFEIASPKLMPNQIRFRNKQLKTRVK